MPRRKITDMLAWFHRARSAEPPREQEDPPSREGEEVRIYRADDEGPNAPRQEKPSGSHVSAKDLPFASFVQEILEEYRSDSSPTRYAMAVELEEEGAQPPPPEDPFSEDKEAPVPLLHALWNDSEDADLPLDLAETEIPPSDTWDWMDILKEFRSDPAAEQDRTADSAAEAAPEKADALGGEEHGPLTGREESVPADGEETVPAGFRQLTEMKAAVTVGSAPAPRLSVEEILAEYQGFTFPEETPEEAEPAPRSEQKISRRARMEQEARSLFSRKEREPAKPERGSAPESGPDAARPSGEPEMLSFSFSSETEDAPESAAAQIPAAEGAAPAEARSESAPDADTPEEPKRGLKKRLKAMRRDKTKKEKDAKSEDDGTAGLKDTDVSPSLYAPDGDYETEEEPEDAFPSFGEYVVGMATGLWLRIRGLGPRSDAGAETMETDEEELGQEVSPAAASRYYGSFVRSLRFRFRLCLILWIVMVYITVGLPVTGMLRTIDVAAGMLLALQLGIMLLCLDVVTNCAINLVRGRFGADSLAILLCFLTSIDALSVLLMGFGTPHVPLCLLSSFSLMGVLYASYLNARGLRKSLRVPAIGRRAYSVTAETELTEKTVTLVKASRPPLGFVRRSEEASPDETAYCQAAPVLLALAVLMSLVIVLIKKAPSQYLFVLTALLAPAVPVTALMSYAMPFFIGSQRIFTSGAAIAGWSGLCDIGSSHNLIVTDRDLFPDNSVSIETVRIFADIPSEQVIACAGTMITASGSGLAACFADLMERNGCRMRQVENFEILPGGGLCGTIDGQTVLCGGTELMRLMNVRIPYRLIDKTTVLLAIDGVLYGIFNIKYEANPAVRKALVGLMRSNRHPVFAIRDFNINPEMLHETFDVATDGYDFPPYLERYAISEAKPSEKRMIAAVLCREGLAPLVHMADTGRSMYLTVRVNLTISLLSSALGILAVFLQLLARGTISPGALLLYMLFWIIPTTLISLFLRL